MAAHGYGFQERRRSPLAVVRSEPLGNDGLTDSERKRYADQYAKGPARGLDAAALSALAKMRARRSAG